MKATELKEFIQSHTRNTDGEKWHERIECDKNTLTHLINAFAIQVSEEAWRECISIILRGHTIGEIMIRNKEFTDYKPQIKQLK